MNKSIESVNKQLFILYFFDLELNEKLALFSSWYLIHFNNRNDKFIFVIGQSWNGTRHKVCVCVSNTQCVRCVRVGVVVAFNAVTWASSYSSWMSLRFTDLHLCTIDCISFSRNRSIVGSVAAVLVRLYCVVRVLWVRILCCPFAFLINCTFVLLLHFR